jgi:hypothetical protein
MTMAANRFVDVFTRQGMSQDDAEMLAAQAPMFNEFGRLSPQMVRVLAGLSPTQQDQLSKTGDMNVLFDELVRKFPQQEPEINRLRETQLILGDPLQVISRMMIRVVRILTQWSGLVPNLGGALEGATPGKDIDFLKNFMAAGEQGRSTGGMALLRGGAKK